MFLPDVITSVIIPSAGCAQFSRALVVLAAIVGIVLKISMSESSLGVGLLLSSAAIFKVNSRSTSTKLTKTHSGDVVLIRQITEYSGKTFNAFWI